MPLFDMKCGYCGHAETDVLLAYEQDHLCPECGAEYMDRLPASPAFVLKGWGWTGKHYHRGLRAEYKSSEDTLEEDGNGKLRPKAGAGHDAP